MALIFASAHVIPLDMSHRIIAGQEDHHNSMPKLELMAAKLGACVADMLVRELEKEIHVDRNRPKMDTRYQKSIQDLY